MKCFYAVLFCLISQTILAADSTEVKKPTLTLAAIYGNNANYYGQTADDRLPYILGNATFRLPSGFYLSASTYKLLNLGGSGVSEVDLSAGFGWNFKKNFTGDLSYTRSFFPENSPLLQAANENMASAALGYDWNILSTGLSADYAFGNEADMFVTFSNSKLIDLGSLFDENDYITLEPGFDVTAGTQRYLEEYTVRQNKRKNPLGGGILFPPGREEETETTTVTKSSFDVLSYNLSLPIGYNRSNYLFEASYQLSVLGKKVSVDSRKPRSFFNLSFYYQF